MIEETMPSPAKEIQKAEKCYDIVIVGAGPAGMSAAICAARAGLSILLIDQVAMGGEVGLSYKIDNFLGFPGGILGNDLSETMQQQIIDNKIDVVYETVEDILSPHAKVKVIKTDSQNIYKTKTIILALGLEPKKVNKDYEKQFFGRGVSYYAQCDAEFYKDKTVAVLGGGNCACYAANYIAEHVEKLYIIHKSNSLKAVKTLKDKVLTNPKIVPVWNSDVTEVFGIDRVEKIKVDNLETNQHTWIDVKCLFLYVGRIPSVNPVSLEINTDENRFIVTDEYMQTNINGIYAAGDIRSKQIRQIATAVSDGMIASINAGRYIENQL